MSVWDRAIRTKLQPVIRVAFKGEIKWKHLCSYFKMTTFSSLLDSLINAWMENVTSTETYLFERGQWDVTILLSKHWLLSRNASAAPAPAPKWVKAKHSFRKRVRCFPLNAVDRNERLLQTPSLTLHWLTDLTLCTFQLAGGGGLFTWRRISPPVIWPHSERVVKYVMS